MRSSELFRRRRLVVIVLCCVFFVAVWREARCHVSATDDRDTRRVNIRTRTSFPFGETNNTQNSIIIVVAFLFEEKTKREREKRRPKKRIVVGIRIGKRNGRTMRDALKDDAFFCVHTAQQRWWVFSLCFIFRVSKKKREKKEEGKKEGDCVTVFVALVFAPSAPVFPPKALTTIYHSLFCSKRRRRRRMIPNALHKPFYTVRCSFVLSLCLSSTVAIFKSIQTAFVL